MTQSPPLAPRGKKLISSAPLPTYIAEHDRLSADVDPSDPDRYIGLAVSENHRMWDLLEPQLNRNRGVLPRSVAYDDMTGSETFRTVLAQFTSEHVWGRPVDSGNVIALAGVGSVLESLFFTISSPGDGVMVPTPSYAGFWMDLETRNALTIVPVHTEARTEFRLAPELLERAYQDAAVPISAIMLTTPDNPTGRTMDTETLRSAIEWARGHDLHIVVNEIYALSVRSDGNRVTVVSAVEDVGSDIHEVWGFSKDFAMSGVRCGVLTTNNQDVLDAVGAIAYWSAVSGDTQHLLSNMLLDTAWTDEFLRTMRTRLSASYNNVTQSLEAANIPYVPAQAGLFVLVDLRKYLDEPTWEAEDRLWRRILDEANVNITPGSACHIAEPGFFRICFATEPPEVTTKALTRITSIL